MDINIHDGYICTKMSKTFSNGTTEPLTAASNQCGFAFQTK